MIIILPMLSGLTYAGFIFFNTQMLLRKWIWYVFCFVGFCLCWHYFWNQENYFVVIVAPICALIVSNKGLNPSEDEEEDEKTKKGLKI